MHDARVTMKFALSGIAAFAVGILLVRAVPVVIALVAAAPELHLSRPPGLRHPGGGELQPEAAAPQV